MSEAIPEDTAIDAAQVEDKPIALGNADVEQFLDVGLVAIVDMQPNQQTSERYEGTIIGWRPNSFIIWQTRVDPKRPWRIVHDDQSVLRFFSNGHACAVKSYLMDWQARGATRIVYLTWPESVSYRVVRKQGRVDTELDCVATLQSGETTNGTMLQLSPDGCRVFLPLENAKDLPKDVTFTLPNGVEVTALPIEVRHASPITNGVNFGCSVDCGQLQQDVRNALSFFIDVALRKRDVQRHGSKQAVILAKASDNHTELIAELQSREVDAVVAHGVVECFAWLQERGAAVIYIDGEVTDPSPIEVATIIRQSAIFRTVPLYIFGGDASALKSEAENLDAQHIGSLAPSSELIDSIVEQLSNDSADESAEAPQDEQ